MTPNLRQSSPQAVKKRSFQEKRDSTEEQGRASIPASGSSGDRGVSGGASAEGQATSGESNNEEPQAQQQASEPAHVQAHGAEPQGHCPSRTSSGAHTPTLSKKRKASSAPVKSGNRPKLPRPDGVPNCPRCCSYDTKFCYYNNYNVKQPRYFCKACQRYWTAGGTLRNVPIGAGRRKHKNHAARQQTRLAPQSSAQTHVPSGSLEGLRMAELLQHQHMPAALPAGLHPGLLPGVGVGVGMGLTTLPHLGTATLGGTVFVPEAPLTAAAHTLAGHHISRPGSTSLGRSSDTLVRFSNGLNSKSVPSKTGNGNSNGSQPSSERDNKTSDEGSVHMRRHASSRLNVRTAKASGEHANGEISGQGPHAHQKGSGSDPLRAMTNSPSPPAAPSNGTLSHDSGVLLPNGYPGLAAFSGPQNGDAGFAARDGAPAAWHLGASPHPTAFLANLQATNLGFTPSYSLTHWPYGVYQPPFSNPQYMAAYARASMGNGSWPIEGSHGVVQPAAMSQTAVVPPGVGVGMGKDGTPMLAAGHTNGSQIFPGWPGAGMAFNGWSQEPTAASTWQQNWACLAATADARGPAPAAHPHKRIWDAHMHQLLLGQGTARTLQDLVNEAQKAILCRQCCVDFIQPEKAPGGFSNFTSSWMSLLRSSGLLQSL
eukprot:jgi/Botrbrau1/18751/Bobra.0386s0074.1